MCVESTARRGADTVWTYVSNLVRDTRESRTEGRRGHFGKLDWDLQCGREHSCQRTHALHPSLMATHHSPGTLHAELDAERASREGAEATWQDP